MAMAEADFISCEFTTKSPTSKTLMRWGRPDEVFVSVQLPGRGAQSAAQRGRRWQGVPAGAEKLQKLLATWADLRSGTVHDYTLYLKRGGKKIASMMWAADSETKELTELRGLLEGVGHLAFAEALAYWEEGHQMTQHKLHEKAAYSLSTGTRILGDRYRTPGLRDDTGTYLVFAEHQARAGKLDLACGFHDRLLRCRLAIYRQVHKLPGLDAVL
jgi:hypothetical protein